MAKANLVERTAEVTGQSEELVQAVLDAYANAIAQALVGGSSVELPGVGRLVTREQPSRQGRNPMTGEVITIAGSRRVTFRPARELQAQLTPASDGEGDEESDS